MNHYLGQKLVEISKALKGKHESGKSFHISAAVRKGRIIKIAWNDYRFHHNAKKWGEYKNFKNLPGKFIPSRHSELALATKLGEDDWRDFEIYNLRINNNLEVANSMPCLNCLNIVRQLRPKRMYFTNSLGVFELLDY